MTGKEKRKRFKQALKTELRENRKTFIVYSVLRVLVIIMMVLQLFNQNYENVFLCLLTLLLMIVPSVLQVTFKVEFPSGLEIIVLLFIFAAEILGEISSFYIYFPHWDTILHTLNGFLCAAIGFSLVDMLNRGQRFSLSLSPFLRVALTIISQKGIMLSTLRKVHSTYSMERLELGTELQCTSRATMGSRIRAMPTYQFMMG